MCHVDKLSVAARLSNLTDADLKVWRCTTFSGIWTYGRMPECLDGWLDRQTNGRCIRTIYSAHKPNCLPVIKILRKFWLTEPFLVPKFLVLYLGTHEATTVVGQTDTARQLLQPVPRQGRAILLQKAIDVLAITLHNCAICMNWPGACTLCCSSYWMVGPSLCRVDTCTGSVRLIIILTLHCVLDGRDMWHVWGWGEVQLGFGGDTWNKQVTW